MTAWLLRNWFPLSAASALTLIVCVILHNLSIARIEAKHTTEISNIKAAMTQQCEADKAITSEVSSEYQTKISDLNDKLRNARKLYERSCVNVVADPAIGRDAATKEGKSSGSDAGGYRVRATEIIDLAAEGEQYRLQLIGCQSFIKKTWGNKLND